MTYPDNLVDPKDLYSQVSEAIFQHDVITRARELGYEAYSHNSVGTRCKKCGEYVRGGRIVTSKGFPDLVLARMDPPRLIYAELKRWDGRQTKEQRLWQALLEASGADYYLWRPADLDELTEILARR